MRKENTVLQTLDLTSISFWSKIFWRPGPPHFTHNLKKTKKKTFINPTVGKSVPF